MPDTVAALPPLVSLKMNMRRMITNSSQLAVPRSNLVNVPVLMYRGRFYDPTGRSRAVVRRL